MSSYNSTDTYVAMLLPKHCICEPCSRYAKLIFEVHNTGIIQTYTKD